MTDPVKEPFCPLYREAIEAAPWKSSESAHAGLLFDKFADAWRYKRAINGNRVTPAEPEFDRGVGRNKDGANDWLNGFKREVGDSKRLTEVCARQRKLVERLGGELLLLTNTDRFVTGMGREHPLENGFAWHHTLGVPYLPGSSLKGMLRAWLRETEGDVGPARHRAGEEFKDNDNIRLWFGTQGQTGQVILLDMPPIRPPKLTVDVMTPHYGPYYLKESGNDIPGDWHSPIPITFLTVEEGASWQLGIVPACGSRRLNDADLEKLTADLLEAINVSGAGAKTAVGYGRFVVDTAAEQSAAREEAERRAAEDEAARRAAEQAAFEASITGDSEPLRQLKQLRRDQNWQLSAGNHGMIQALKQFAEQTPDPPTDCLDWIRELLESIPNYQGVWNEPDAMRGKKKDKPKYHASTVRELVKRLNPQFR